MTRGLCWIRRDLRLSDQRALFETCAEFDEVAVVFVFDTNILDHLENKADRRVSFIFRALEEVNANLAKLGSSLIILRGDPRIEIPKLVADLKFGGVVAARDWEPYAIQRDQAVYESLAQRGIHFATVKDQVIFEKGEILNKSESVFQVFTPYSRRWLERLEEGNFANRFDPNLAKLLPDSVICPYSSGLDYATIGFEPCDPWILAGEVAGLKLLQDFEARIDQYKDLRDIPSINGTSHLSVHLRFGTISVREAVRTALRHTTMGSKKWLTELIWREFYQDILANSPHVIESTFDPDYAELEWPGQEEHFDIWRLGKTGFPIVDAAMRCFAETGWMHNRLRMIVASFLTKDLLLDYKKGEAYFASLLLDFDLASNNGGWQWAAGVGCDAQPYFRIFNPYLQSERFDCEGKFIRQWVPELAGLDDKSIHHPSAFDCQLAGYPLPIVEHDVQRKLAITMFEQAKKNLDQLS